MGEGAFDSNCGKSERAAVVLSYLACCAPATKGSKRWTFLTGYFDVSEKLRRKIVRGIEMGVGSGHDFSAAAIVQRLFACMIQPCRMHQSVNRSLHHSRRPILVVPDPIFSPQWRTIQEECSKVEIVVFLNAPPPQPSPKNVRARAWSPGATYFDPIASVQLKWLSVDERRSLYEKSYCMDTSTRGSAYDDFGEEGYDEDEAYSDDDETTRSEDACNNREPELKPDWILQGYENEEMACMDNYNAKSMEEVLWDEHGVPRLDCLTEHGDCLLLKAGWEFQGYKPGRSFVLSEDSVRNGTRLVHHKGLFFEEPRKDRSAGGVLGLPWEGQVQKVEYVHLKLSS